MIVVLNATAVVVAFFYFCTMYNLAKLQEEFKGLIGFLQPSDPKYPHLKEELTTSNSGIFASMVHPLCTVETLWSAGPPFQMYSDPALENATVAFNDWLANLYNSSVQQLFSDLLRYRTLEYSNRTFIDSLKLFDGAGRYGDFIIPRGRTVGLAIKIRPEEGLAAQLTRIGLQFAGEGQFPIRLRHSSLVDPIGEYTVSIEKSGSFQWSKLPADKFTLSYIGEWSTEGQFYLEYDENELPDGMQAIKRDSTWMREPCIGCSDWNLQSYRKWSKHVDINAFYINGPWDESKIQYLPTTNWGMNLAISISCDLTDFFIQNKQDLANAVSYSLCVKLLEQIGYTTRINAIPDQVKVLALKDLSVEDKDSFYNAKYKKEIEAVSLNFGGLSSNCNKTTKKNLISLKAI